MEIRCKEQPITPNKQQRKKIIVDKTPLVIRKPL